MASGSLRRGRSSGRSVSAALSRRLSGNSYVVPNRRNRERGVAYQSVTGRQWRF